MIQPDLLFVGTMQMRCSACRKKDLCLTHLVRNAPAHPLDRWSQKHRIKLFRPLNVRHSKYQMIHKLGSAHVILQSPGKLSHNWSPIKKPGGEFPFFAARSKLYSLHGPKCRGPSSGPYELKL